MLAAGVKKAAKEGGAAAGDALKAYEKRTDSKVVTSINFKHQIEEAKKSKLVKGKDDELNIWWLGIKLSKKVNIA